MTPLLALVLWLAPGAAVLPAFPDTEAGRRAAGLFAALDADEAVLRAFLEANVSAEGLKRRPVGERLAVLRSLREEHGRLTVTAVRDVAADRVSVEARGEHGGQLDIDVLLEPEPPHLLAGLRVMDTDGPGGAAPPAGPPLTPAEVVGALREHLASLADGFSGAVLLARGDEVLFRQAYGLASREERRPNRPETRFNLGSINKAFTRIAVERLAAAGRLSLSDTLERWVPEYPAEKARRITLQQLLDHTAGTGDFFGPRFEAADHSRLLTLRDWLPLIVDEPLHFEPGSRHEYSNAGYLLLGLVIEKASGQSYFDHVREQVFLPAGMRDSGWFTRAEGGATLATGYTKGERGLGPNHATLPARGSSAGGGYSTVDDLLRFAGWLRRSGGGGLAVGGGAPGVNAWFAMEGEWTAVVLTNLDPPSAEAVGERLAGWLRRAGAPDGSRRIVRAGADGDEHGRPGATQLPAGGVEVPMRRAGHLPAVEVTVDGQGPFLFAIDTGGAGTLRIDEGLAKRLALPTVGEVRAGDPSGRNLRTLPLLAVRTLEIGGARFEGLVGASRDYNEGRSERVDGVLGFGLFADVLFTLDYPGQKVRLAAGTLPEPDGREVVEFTAEDGIPSIPLTLAGQTVPAHLDAGSMGGLVLHESMAASLPLAGPLQVVGRARTISNSFEIRAAPLAGEARVGGLVLDRPMLEFQPVIPHANVGSRVLRDLVLTFDQRQRRVRLAR